MNINHWFCDELSGESGGESIRVTLGDCMGVAQG